MATESKFVIYVKQLQVFNRFFYQHRIELRFRPDDPFCKPAHGERIQTSNLLLKVVKKTRRNKKTNETTSSYHVRVEGVIGTTYRFTSILFST